VKPLLLSLAALAAGAPAPAQEEGTPPAAVSPVRIAEGDWLLYRGVLKLETRRPEDEPEEVTVGLEVAYLGMGGSSSSSGAAGGQEVLVLRSGESPDKKDVAVSEAVSCLARPDLSLEPRYPLEDRAARVSPFLFKHLPLGIFPALPATERLEATEARSWKGPAALQVLSSKPRTLAASHRLEPAPAGVLRYTVEAEAGQKSPLLEEGVEVVVEILRLKEVFDLDPARGRLLKFESSLEARMGPVQGAAQVRLSVELTQSEALKLEGSRWKQLLAEARQVEEIERTLFQALDPETAQSRAAAFKKEHAGSRLLPFAAGLSLQADEVRPIVRERRLYGKPAPDFTLMDLDGKEATLSALLPGKVTLLSFFEVG
jgi:hypothetical protein